MVSNKKLKELIVWYNRNCFVNKNNDVDVLVCIFDENDKITDIIMANNAWIFNSIVLGLKKAGSKAKIGITTNDYIDFDEASFFESTEKFISSLNVVSSNLPMNVYQLQEDGFVHRIKHLLHYPIYGEKEIS